MARRVERRRPRRKARLPGAPPPSWRRERVALPSRQVREATPLRTGGPPTIDPDPRTPHPATLAGDVRNEGLRLRNLIAASKTRSLSLFDLSPIGYVLLDRDGTIRTMNLTLATMLGQSRTDMEGRLFALSVVGGERPRFLQHMNAAAAAATTPVTCDLNLLGSGSVGLLPVHVITRAVHRGSETPRAFIMAVIDQKIQTETIAALQASGLELRREARALEARTREAERANLTLRGLAREVNKAEQLERQRIARLLHDDLQQLLVSAKMRLNMGRADDSRAEQVREVGDLIDAAIRSSRSLTAQISPPLLHEAGLEAGLRWLARFVLEHHDLRVDLRLALGPTPIDFSDRDFLFQAARELLFNVVKHSGVRKAKLSVFFSDDHLTLEVTDRGGGFDEASLDRMSAAPTQHLGLRTLRERVRLLGGTFVIDADPGRGTRVHIDLPLSEAQEKEEVRHEVPQPASSSAARTRRSGRVRVLIADDHRVVREGIQSLLGQESWIEIVGQAADGREAVLMTGALQPDVVIMDISMPELNGIEATRIIAGESPQVRIIGMSMHQQEDMATAMISAGAGRYLTKGGPAEELIEAVRELGRGPDPGHAAPPDRGAPGNDRPRARSCD